MDPVHFSGGHDFKNSCEAGLWESDIPFLLCFDNKEVSSVVGGVGEYIQTVASSFRVRDRYCAPSVHEKQYTGQGEEKEKMNARAIPAASAVPRLNK